VYTAAQSGFIKNTKFSEKFPVKKSKFRKKFPRNPGNFPRHFRNSDFPEIRFGTLNFPEISVRFSWSVCIMLVYKLIRGGNGTGYV
jgi:hypothetical protein